MLIDRYPPEEARARVPELADQTDPVLVQLDRLLDDDRFYQQVRADLVLRDRLTAVRGRHSTPAEELLRLLVVRQVYSWSFEETEERVADSLVLRWFTRVYFRRVPDDTTVLRWAHTLQPETLHALVARAAQLAAQARVTRAQKLWVDGPVVETTIQYPTDSRLLGEGVRVLTRLGKLAKPLVAEFLAGGRDAFRRRTRSMQRTLQALYRQVRHRSEAAAQAAAEQRRQLYTRLIGVTEQTIRQARRVRQVLAQVGAAPEPCPSRPAWSQRLFAEWDHFLPEVLAGGPPGTHRGIGRWEGAAPGESGQLVRTAHPRAATREAWGAGGVWTARGAR